MRDLESLELIEELKAIADVQEMSRGFNDGENFFELNYILPLVIKSLSDRNKLGMYKTIVNDYWCEGAGYIAKGMLVNITISKNIISFDKYSGEGSEEKKLKLGVYRLDEKEDHPDIIETLYYVFTNSKKEG